MFSFCKTGLLTSEAHTVQKGLEIHGYAKADTYSGNISIAGWWWDGDVGLASFPLWQVRGGSRKAKVCEEGLEHIFCRVPTSKGNLYLWEMAAWDRASRFPSLLLDATGSLGAPIHHAHTSSSWTSLSFLIEMMNIPWRTNTWKMVFRREKNLEQFYHKNKFMNRFLSPCMLNNLHVIIC